VSTLVAPPDQRWFAEISKPTPAQLDSLAKIILDGANNDKPIKVTWFNNDWTPPLGIELVKQQKMSAYEQDIWLMTKREVSPLDAFLGR
jgi:hypothetical protein